MNKFQEAVKTLINEILLELPGSEPIIAVSLIAVAASARGPSGARKLNELLQLGDNLFLKIRVPIKAGHYGRSLSRPSTRLQRRGDAQRGADVIDETARLLSR